jgi:acetate kinase
MMANILVLNAGSGSQKVALYAFHSLSEAASPPLWQAEINSTTPGQPEGHLVAQMTSARGKAEVLIPRDSPLPSKIETLIRASWEGASAVLDRREQIDLIGHRVVHGGLEFSCAILVNPQVESTIARLGELAPLHNPQSLAGISACRELLGNQVPQFAVFDTAFHRTLPEAAATYAGPFEWIEQGFVRYGFHGTSYRYASKRAAEIIGRPNDENLCQILCHLGGGCSLAAVRGTSCIDTTMGIYTDGRDRDEHTIRRHRPWPDPTSVTTRNLFRLTGANSQSTVRACWPLGAARRYQDHFSKSAHPGSAS